MTGLHNGLFDVFVTNPNPSERYIRLSRASISSSIEAARIKISSRNIISCTISFFKRDTEFSTILERYLGLGPDQSTNIGIGKADSSIETLQTRDIPDATALKNKHCWDRFSWNPSDSLKSNPLYVEPPSILQKKQTFHFEELLWYMFV